MTNPPSSFLGSVVRGWDRFWFRPGDPTTLSLIRILVGLLAFYVHLSYSWDLLTYVGPEAWLDDSVARFVRLEQPIYAPGSSWDEPYVEVARGNYYWSVYYHVRDPRWIVVLHVVFLTAMLLLTLGVWTRAAALVSWVGAISYCQRAATTVFGMDTMMLILLFYLLLGPSGDNLSLDRLWACWRARKQGLPEPPVPKSVMANLAIRLIQVHLCVIYLAGGTSKLLGSTWWSGTALNLVLLNYSFAPLEFPLYFHAVTYLASHRWMWALFTTGGIVYTMFVEIGFPFLVWDLRWRWVMICCSILLHTGIGLFMGLVAFSLFMLVMVLSFIPPEVVRNLLDSGRTWLQRGPDRRRAQAGKTADNLVLSGRR